MKKFYQIILFTFIALGGVHAWAGDSGELVELQRLVNVQRVEAGLDPLVLDDKLNLAAQGHADDMVARNYFSHTSPDGEEMRGRLGRAGARYLRAGENIAFGQSSAEEVMSAWMNSPGHRDNLMNPAFHKLGLGLNSWKWVQDFTN